MKKYTELLKRAREQLGKYGKALLVMTGEAPVENNRICNEIDAAISATKEECDEQWERIQESFEPLRTALENADKEILRLAHEVTTQEVRAENLTTYATTLEKAGDDMREAHSGTDIKKMFDTEDQWAAARKAKP